MHQANTRARIQILLSRSQKCADFLCHLLDEVVDVLLSVTVVAAFGEVVGLLLPAAGWVVELERPEEVGDGLEVRAGSHNLVHNVFNADDALVAECAFDDGVVGERGSSLLHLAVATLVDEVPDSLEVWVTVGNVWLDDSDHVDGGLVHLDKDGVVDLEETEELEDLLDLWRNRVDTLDPDEDGDLGLGRDVEVADLSGVTLQTDGVSFGLSVFTSVAFGSLEDDLTVGLGNLLGFGICDCLFSRVLFGGLSLLEQGFWDTWTGGEEGRGQREILFFVGGGQTSQLKDGRRSELVLLILPRQQDCLGRYRQNTFTCTLYATPPKINWEMVESCVQFL